jgi:hypothetical protein
VSPLDHLAYVVSVNVKRRHLTATQRAMAAAEAWEIAEKEGRVQTKGGDRLGDNLKGRANSQ